MFANETYRGLVPSDLDSDLITQDEDVECELDSTAANCSV